MLHSLSTGGQCNAIQEVCDSRYKRCEKDDMKQAIELLYEFKKKIDELHPNCLNLIDHIIQQRRF